MGEADGLAFPIAAHGCALLRANHDVVSGTSRQADRGREHRRRKELPRTPSSLVAACRRACPAYSPWIDGLLCAPRRPGHTPDERDRREVTQGHCAGTQRRAPALRARAPLAKRDGGQCPPLLRQHALAMTAVVVGQALVGSLRQALAEAAAAGITLETAPLVLAAGATTVAVSAAIFRAADSGEGVSSVGGCDWECEIKVKTSTAESSKNL